MDVKLYRGASPTAHTLYLGPVTLVFSYQTIVAFAVSGEGWTVSENVWSQTTGKHINQETPHMAERVPHAEFQARLEALLKRFEVRDNEPATVES